MKYFVFDYQRDGTCYHEFYKGKWDGKTFWKSDSISLSDDDLDYFYDAIREVIPQYDPYGDTEISIDQWNKIGEMILTKHIKTQEIYREADDWLKSQVFPKYNCFTILGI